MPIIIKDFKWRQTEKLMIIELPLKGIHQSKVDIFTASEYIKASYEIYFFEVFLLHNINTLKSKCTLTPSEIIFELVKCDNQLWEKLEIDIPKSEKMKLKGRLIQQQHEKLQADCKEKYNKKCELKRLAVREQISLDNKQKEYIESIKSSEKCLALGDFKQMCDEITLKSNPTDSILNKREIKSSVPIVLKKMQKHKSLQHTSIPFPRKTATLHIEFTERQFPTPSRESKLEEENEWLRKQTELRRSVGFVSEDLRPEEKNPQYLKTKGEEFLKSKNYLGAISAFSFGIKLCKEFPDLHVGRSRAHFELGNYYKAVQDCSTALELLRPAVSANLNERVECISRRGMSLCKIGLFTEGIQELEAAVRLQPSNSDLRKNLETIKNAT